MTDQLTIIVRGIGREMSSIVCLGWGSLIWCQKTLPVKGAWEPDGPSLPLEFARESRDRRFTLVVCEGSPAIRTLWAALNAPDLESAKHALAEREGVKAENIKYSIGWWSPAGTSGHHGSEAIAKWAAERNLEGVVWTALKPRIAMVNRTPTEDEVIDHLRGLSGTEQEVAEEYIRLAPRQITTPYRTAIEDALGWTPSGLI